MEVYGQLLVDSPLGGVTFSCYLPRFRCYPLFGRYKSPVLSMSFTRLSLSRGNISIR